jgi:hypothetical protein
LAKVAAKSAHRCYRKPLFELFADVPLCAQLQTFSMLVETTKSRHNFIKTDDRKWVDADRRLSVIIFEKPSIVHHGSLRSIARRKSSGMGIF